MSDERETLLADLANWAPPMERAANRALSDRVLEACGWQSSGGLWTPIAQPDMAFLDGGHPHPLQRLDDALAILPPGWLVVEMRLLDHPRLWLATAVHVTKGKRVAPMHVCLSVAVATAAVLAWAEERHG